MKLRCSLLVLIMLSLSSCCTTQKAVVFYVEPSAHSVTIIDSKSLDTVYKKGATDSLKIIYRKCDCKRSTDAAVICLKRKYYYISLKRVLFDEKKILFKPKKPIVDTIYFE